MTRKPTPLSNAGRRRLVSAQLRHQRAIARAERLTQQAADAEAAARDAHTALKIAAVQAVDNGHGVVEVSAVLGINRGTLTNWRNA